MFAANVDFKTLQREISAVRGISDHENIVKLFEVDEEVRGSDEHLMRWASRDGHLVMGIL